jgi:uncharacterized protein (UPF0248 family)
MLDLPGSTAFGKRIPKRKLQNLRLCRERGRSARIFQHLPRWCAALPGVLQLPPKQKFYDNLNVSSDLKRVFVEQINLVTWRNKIAPSTLNIAGGETVKEIEVISIRVNQRNLDKRVMHLIDREIPYHILFLLEYGDEVQAWIGYKEQSKASAFKLGAYYHTEWLAPEDLNLRLDGLNMDKVYENFIRQIAGTRLDDKDGGIKDAISRDERRRKLAKEIAALEKKVQREKQFNRQVELNARLKLLRKELTIDD